jgi:hypothetical protein
MSEAESAEPKVVVELTEEQRKSVLYALEDKLLETERYIGQGVPDEPAPHHSCCDFHLQRYERDKEIYQAMKARKRAIKSTIKLFKKSEGPHG